MSAGIDECLMIQHVVQVSTVSSEASVSNQPGSQISCCWALQGLDVPARQRQPGAGADGFSGAVEGRVASDSIGMIGS
jgi:hypothetical protein